MIDYGDTDTTMIRDLELLVPGEIFFTFTPTSERFNFEIERTEIGEQEDFAAGAVYFQWFKLVFKLAKVSGRSCAAHLMLFPNNFEEGEFFPVFIRYKNQVYKAMVTVIIHGERRDIRYPMAQGPNDAGKLIVQGTVCGDILTKEELDVELVKARLNDILDPRYAFLVRPSMFEKQMGVTLQ